jgi:hypothetical protein
MGNSLRGEHGLVPTRPFSEPCGFEITPMLAGKQRVRQCQLAHTPTRCKSRLPDQRSGPSQSSSTLASFLGSQLLDSPLWRLQHALTTTSVGAARRQPAGPGTAAAVRSGQACLLLVRRQLAGDDSGRVGTLATVSQGSSSRQGLRGGEGWSAGNTQYFISKSRIFRSSLCPCQSS